MSSRSSPPPPPRSHQSPPSPPRRPVGARQALLALFLPIAAALALPSLGIGALIWWRASKTWDYRERWSGTWLMAIIGLLVSLGGGKQWKATTEIYLGNPLSPNGAAPITSPPTSLALATTFASSEAALRYAATRSGIPTAQLRGKITVKPIVI